MFWRNPNLYHRRYSVGGSKSQVDLCLNRAHDLPHSNLSHNLWHHFTVILKSHLIIRTKFTWETQEPLQMSKWWVLIFPKHIFVNLFIFLSNGYWHFEENILNILLIFLVKRSYYGSYDSEFKIKLWEFPMILNVFQMSLKLIHILICWLEKSKIWLKKWLKTLKAIKIQMLFWLPYGKCQEKWVGKCPMPIFFLEVPKFMTKSFQ